MRKFFSMKIFIFARISLIFSLFTTSFTRSKLPIGLCAFSQYFLFYSLLLISIPSHLALGGASFSSQLSFIKLKTLSREFLSKFYFSHPTTLGRDWSENSILSLTRIVRKFHLNLHAIRGWHFFGLLCGEIKPQIAVASCKLHPTTSVKSAIHINLLCSWKRNSIKSIFTLLPRSDFEWKSLCLPSSLYFVCCVRQWPNWRRRHCWGEQTCLLSAKNKKNQSHESSAAALSRIRRHTTTSAQGWTMGLAIGGRQRS